MVDGGSWVVGVVRGSWAVVRGSLGSAAPGSGFGSGPGVGAFRSRARRQGPGGVGIRDSAQPLPRRGAGTWAQDSDLAARPQARRHGRGSGPASGPGLRLGVGARVGAQARDSDLVVGLRAGPQARRRRPTGLGLGVRRCWPGSASGLGLGTTVHEPPHPRAASHPPRTTIHDPPTHHPPSTIHKAPIHHPRTAIHHPEVHAVAHRRTRVLQRDTPAADESERPMTRVAHRSARSDRRADAVRPVSAARPRVRKPDRGETRRATDDTTCGPDERDTTTYLVRQLLQDGAA